MKERVNIVLVVPISRNATPSFAMIFPVTIITQESGKSYGNTWTINELDLVLRDHRNKEEGSIKPPEDEIRKSFDSLLHFYCKLDYLIKMKQLTPKEKFIFQYYIDLVKIQPVVLEYIKIYNFPLCGNLDPSLTNLGVKECDQRQSDPLLCRDKQTYTTSEGLSKKVSRFVFRPKKLESHPGHM